MKLSDKLNQLKDEYESEVIDYNCMQDGLQRAIEDAEYLEEKKELIESRVKLNFYKKLERKINMVLNSELDLEDWIEDVSSKIESIEDKIGNLED